MEGWVIRTIGLDDGLVLEDLLERYAGFLQFLLELLRVFLFLGLLLH